MIAWSYGGGIQSVCTGVLIGEGALPVPDLAFIVDTSREASTTWTYLREHMQPYLKRKVGLTIQVAPHSLARVDVYDRKKGGTLLPAYTTEGRLSAFCSGEWKRDATERWLRQQGVKECVQWIGYSIDELHRAQKQDHRRCAGWSSR